MRLLRGERVFGSNSHFLDRLHEGILQVGGYEDILRAHADLDALADERRMLEVGKGGRPVLYRGIYPRIFFWRPS